MNPITDVVGFFVSPSHYKCEIFSKALHLSRGDESIY